MSGEVNKGLGLVDRFGISMPIEATFPAGIKQACRSIDWRIMARGVPTARVGVLVLLEGDKMQRD